MDILELLSPEIRLVQQSYRSFDSREMSGSGTSSPSDIGGGSDMCDGLMALLKPAVEELDKQVFAAKKSQVIQFHALPYLFIRKLSVAV